MMTRGHCRQTLLIFSQTFVPDPASVGQHMADVAQEMARRGHRVLVYTANRGYENPQLKYAARETLNGVEIRRLSFSSFGKKSILLRALATFSFMVQCLIIALATRNLKGIFFSTSPPLVGAAAALAGMLRKVPLAYWAMDLNPDQLIAMGKLRERDLAARVLERVNRFILRRVSLVVALDRFMADRLRARQVPEHKLVVMPPWPHEEHIEAMDPEASPFRAAHGLNGKFVIMYSGNHSPANPLKTLLDAALRLKDDDSLRFLFVGGGSGKQEVESYIGKHRLTNVISLPYQPLANLGNSLSAADVHVVSLGDEMVGIVHPCKIYGAMAVGRPILYLGPQPSHIADLLQVDRFGWRVAHGDLNAALRTLETIRAVPRDELRRMGQTAKRLLHERLSQAQLSREFCDHLERLFGPAEC
ncbi:MAG: glycosyltransferase family 4 protein [Pirellulales bacterium]